jgi:hypothetical protein
VPPSAENSSGTPLLLLMVFTSRSFEKNPAPSLATTTKKSNINLQDMHLPELI